MIKTLGILLVLFCIKASTCKKIQVNLPAASNPIIESIYSRDANGIGRIVAQNTDESYTVLPADIFVLHVRAPQWTTFQLKMNQSDLKLVEGLARRPEFDVSGYFSVNEEWIEGEGFYKITAWPPSSLRSPQPQATNVEIINVSRDTTKVPRTALSILRFPRMVGFPGMIGSIPLLQKVEPGQVFQSGWNSKDSRDIGPWQAHASQSLVARKVVLAGWLSRAPWINEAGIYIEGRSDRSEDSHYSIYLDPDFIDRTYRAYPNALPLIGAKIKGNPSNFLPYSYPEANDILLLASGVSPDVGTFTLPGNMHTDENMHIDKNIHIELNAWHRSVRLTPPSGWFIDQRVGKTDNYWPFNPFLPSADIWNSGLLAEGDYVIISGTLWQDSGHDGNPLFPNPAKNCWNFHFRGHSGWLELHPADMVRRVPAPKLRKQVHVVSLCAIPGEVKESSFLLHPYDQDSANHPNEKMMWKEFIDARFTKDMQSRTISEIRLPSGNPNLKVDVRVGGSNGGCFKAVYTVWWQRQ